MIQEWGCIQVDTVGMIFLRMVYQNMIFFLYFSVFGLGTLIFTGLEIAMHATMEKNCVENILIAHPILQALFTFLQMHFLFVNSQVRCDFLQSLHQMASYLV